MNYCFLGFLLLFSNQFFAQVELDTSRLAVIGEVGLEKNEILLVDSLLLATIDYYNSRVSRGYNQISLTDAEYAEYLYYDALKTEISPFLKKNGKVRKQKLKQLNDDQFLRMDSLVNVRNAIYAELARLKSIGLPNRNDTIISSWGSAEFIDLETYFRQYQVYSKNGSKTVLVHCFCDDILRVMKTRPLYNESVLRTSLVAVHDGGSCFFSMVISLATLEVHYVKMNGIR